MTKRKKAVYLDEPAVEAIETLSRATGNRGDVPVLSDSELMRIVIAEGLASLVDDERDGLTIRQHDAARVPSADDERDDTVDLSEIFAEDASHRVEALREHVDPTSRSDLVRD